MKAEMPGRITLCGFMGVGKTTIGKSLAARLDYSFVDLDEQIERAAGCSVQEIFKQEGEAAFRKKERRALAACLNRSKTVIALGGGALHNESVVSKIKEKSLLIFIECPQSVILERIAGDRTRPLLLDKNENLKEMDILNKELKSLYEKRLPYYRQAALTIDGSVYSTAQRTAVMLHNKIEEYNEQH